MSNKHKTGGGKI